MKVLHGSFRDFVYEKLGELDDIDLTVVNSRHVTLGCNLWQIFLSANQLGHGLPSCLFCMDASNKHGSLQASLVVFANLHDHLLWFLFVILAA